MRASKGSETVLHFLANFILSLGVKKSCYCSSSLDSFGRGDEEKMKVNELPRTDTVSSTWRVSFLARALLTDIAGDIREFGGPPL